MWNKKKTKGKNRYLKQEEIMKEGKTRRTKIIDNGKDAEG
jgi:hypothetical protein